MMGITCRRSRAIQISPGHSITALEYADDVVVLFSDSYKEMQIMLNDVVDETLIESSRNHRKDENASCYMAAKHGE
ncbi:unnamed protein product [Dracunculus medinensis]|uniref:Reverse transcriptase domain-containing protein n=1 Tax=Dracunculus medinensis TaxID=318479 RepID=A0A0N4UI27_DRAME|nr:unnamed protein product [Dracunculus medinensis]